MRIFLTKRAEKNYRSIKEYIIEEWGERVAQAFEQKTIDFLDLLEDFPEIGVIEMVDKQIHGFQLTSRHEYFIELRMTGLLS